jgi:hypothetical protein
MFSHFQAKRIFFALAVWLQGVAAAVTVAIIYNSFVDLEVTKGKAERSLRKLDKTIKVLQAHLRDARVAGNNTQTLLRALLWKMQSQENLESRLDSFESGISLPPEASQRDKLTVHLVRFAA